MLNGAMFTYWIRLLFILTLVHITLETNPYIAILDSQLDFLFKNIAGFKKKDLRKFKKSKEPTKIKCFAKKSHTTTQSKTV